jgi:phage-related protein
MAFGGTVKLTGESEYKKALADITGNLKVLNSEMKVVTSQYDRNDKSTENLSQQNEVLNKKIAEQEEKVNILSKALKDAKQETGENSATTKQWQTELNNAQAELNKLVKNVNDNEKAMEESASATKDNAESVEKFGKEADESGKKALSLGDIIKANLISDAIKGGLSALASGISEVGSAMSESLSAGAEYADNIITMSVQTGVSTENLQKFNAVAELVDVSTETMTKSMAKNIKSMTSASSGTGAMAEAYKKLGVSVTNADGTLRDSETVYWETIDALKNVADETERDSIAMEILGKSAQELNPLIAQGSEGIKAMGDEAVKMGAVLSEDALNSLGAVDDEIQRMNTITGATSNLFASAFAPAISTLMGGVNDLGSSFNYLISSIISGDSGGVEDAMNMINEGVQSLFANLETILPQLLDLVQNLLTSAVDLIAQNGLWFVNAGEQILQALMSGISDNIGMLIDTVIMLVSWVTTTILENLPMILEMGIQMLTSLVQGIADALPEIIPVMINSVLLMVETLLDNIDLIIETGINLIFALADGLIYAIPDLIDKIPVIIDKLIQALTNNIPLLIEMGITLIVQLGVGLIKAIPNLIKAIPQIISSIVNGFANYRSNMGDVGLNLVKGIWNGIKDATGWILDKIKGFGQSVLDGIKSVFGIHSPSRLFKDEVGKNLALGVGEGFADTMADVSAEMQGAIPTSFDADVNTNFNSGSYTTSNYDMMLMAFKQALKEVKVVMNNREMGEFVTETMERVVFA